MTDTITKSSSQKSSSPQIDRIHRAFSSANQQGRAAFIGYVSAGYPNVERSLEIGKLLLQHADLLEVGLPYSDPLGDGPTIQKANERALAGGMTVRGTFAVARALRQATDKPLVVMTYYNPILATGEERFVDLCLENGVDGLILPDLPPDEADTLIPLAHKAGLGLTFLLAPTSTPERIRVVANATTGFIYAVSVTGVTGARSGLPIEVPAMLERIKAVTDTPVAVGFGVSNRETANYVAQVADGVVAASVFINADANGQPIEPLAREILEGCKR